MAFNYQVSYGSTPNGPWTLVNTVSQTTDVISGLASATSYYFRIIAIDSVTLLQSAPTVSGPFTTSTAIVESTDGAILNAATQTIYASQTIGSAAPLVGPFDTWMITAVGGAVVKNTVTDGSTSNVLELYYHNHTVYHQASTTNSLANPAGSPGWWSYNGAGWTEVASPLPTSPTITVGTVTNQSTNSAFTVTGILQAYSTAPTLQYQDNQAGSWFALPGGSSVSTTTYNFSHPSVATATGSMVVGIRDAVTTTVNSLSNAFAVTTPGAVTIGSVTLSNTTFTAGSPTGTVVGVITVTMLSGSFAGGTLSVTGTNASSFQIVGTNLQTTSSLSAGSYSIAIRADLAGATNTPFTTSTLTITGTAVGAVFNPGIAGLPTPITTSTAISTDFVNNKTAAILNKSIYGVAANASSTFSNSPPYQFQLFVNPTFVNACAPLGFSAVRLNGWSTMHDEIFPSGNPSLGANDTSTPNWAAIDNIINGYKNCFPKSTTLLVSFTGNTKYDYSNTTVQDYVASKSALIAQRLKNGGIRVDYWQAVNEPDKGGGGFATPTAAQIASLISKCKTTIHAVDATIKVGGPVTSFMNTSYISAATNTGGAEFIDWHQYGFDPSLTAPTDAALYAGALGTGGNSFFANARDAQNSTTAKNFVSALTEYNVYFSPQTTDTRQQNFQGAIFNALVTITSTYGGLAIATYWDIGSQDPLYGIFIGTTTNLSSNGAFLQAANLYMPQGNVCQLLLAGSGGNTTNLMGIVSVNSTSFGAILINYDTSVSWTGPITLTNRVSSANITKWMLNSVNNLGVTTTITQASLSSFTLPAASITILSGLI